MFLNQQDITKPELAKTPIVTFVGWINACILASNSEKGFVGGWWWGAGGGRNLELGYTRH